MFSSLPGLYPPDASSTQPPNCDNPKCLKGIAKWSPCWWGVANSPQIENQGTKAPLSPNMIWFLVFHQDTEKVWVIKGPGCISGPSADSPPCLVFSKPGVCPSMWEANTPGKWSSEAQLGSARGNGWKGKEKGSGMCFVEGSQVCTETKAGKTAGFSTSACSKWGQFCLPENIWQHLEGFGSHYN